MAEYRKKQRKKRRGQKNKRALWWILAAAAAVAAVIVIVLAAQMKPGDTKVLRVYPMEYADLIRAKAEENGFDPAYAASIVLAESDYDPLAVSNAGAQGLMQIMPKTAEWIAGKFDETYTEGCLFDPETNLKYGCWYLGYLLRRFGGDLRCATAAYHSGQGTVDKWLQDPAYSSDGKTLDVIAGERANRYVNRVLEYYEKYQELYQG